MVWCTEATVQQVEEITLTFEERAEQAVVVRLADNRRKWQESFEFRFETKVPIEKVMPGGVRQGAKIYVGECEFEPRISSIGPGGMYHRWYMRWRCPDCGYLSEEYYVNSLVDVGTTLSRVRGGHICDVAAIDRMLR